MSIPFPDYGRVVTMSCDQPTTTTYLADRLWIPTGTCVTYVYDNDKLVKGVIDPLGFRPVRPQKPRRKRSAKPRKPGRPKEAQP